jgi:hypothetical protein
MGINDIAKLDSSMVDIRHEGILQSYQNLSNGN